MRSDLDLFVLAMVQQGLVTPYDLKVKAGVSLGSTVPVLARLEDEQLIEAPPPGARRSRRFSVTNEGKKVLRHEWKEQLKGRPTDIDSVLRIAFVAWLNGADDECRAFLERSGQDLRGWAGSLRAEADRLAAAEGELPDANSFRWLRTYCEAARAEAQAGALVELSVRMKNEKKQGKPRSKTTRRRP